MISRIFFAFLFFAFSSLGSSVVIIAENDSEKSYGNAFFLQNGIIVTSYHTVESASSIKIFVAENNYNARIVGFDEVLDVVVLQSEVIMQKFYNIAECKIEDSGKIAHFSGVVLGKIISGNEKTFITNAKGKKGYSGAPFVLNDSSACGVLTGFEKDTGNAIFSHISEDLVESFSNGQNFMKKNLKIYITNLTIEDARFLNVNLEEQLKGVLVTKSENRIIKEWDIITHVNGVATPTVDEFLQAIGTIYASEKAKIQMISKGKIVEIVV